MPYPNQKKITIHKPKYKKEFMQVGIEEWQEAFKRYCKHPEEKTSVLGMYLYLASNADGHEKWLSPAAYINATGKSRASYYRALEILEEDGYIYKDQGGGLNFATTPQKSTEIVCHDWEGDDSSKRQPSIKDEIEESQECNSAISRMNIEINNINNNKYKQINIDNSAPRSSLSDLKEIIMSDGYFQGGEYKGQWLEDIVPNLWGQSRLSRVSAIQQHTNFTESEAHYISYSILDYKKRKFKTVRECDFYEDIFFIGE